MLPVLRSVLPPPTGSADAILQVLVPDRLEDRLLRLRVGERLDVLPGPIGLEVLDRSGLEKGLSKSIVGLSAFFDRRVDRNSEYFFVTQLIDS